MNVDPRGNASVLRLVLIKPTHYDDDGYPIRWAKSSVPSNTLACLNGLAEDAERRQVLGPGVEIRLNAYDEVNQRVRPDRIAAEIRRNGERALIGLVGVQSNQYPRAVDIAREFRAFGLPVCIGGFHVSGSIAMLPEMPPELVEAQALGISLFAGEAEGGRLDELLRDAWAGELKPLYNHMNDLPGLDDEPVPFLPATTVRRTQEAVASIDIGRGCPYQCSFCTIINVQGRKSRSRSPDDLERCIRRNEAQGVKFFFLTDDNLARNRSWEASFDRLIALRQEGLEFGLTIQVDTLCHRIPNFIEKAGAAGVQRVFIGLENINPDNLLTAKKNQNKITEYRTMLQQWRDQGALILAGYILGFPGDTRESIMRDIEIIKNELPIDILDFFILTPLPGSEDHKVQYLARSWLDPDLNKYDSAHAVGAHPKMSARELEETYRAAWDAFLTDDHVRTILRRTAANPRGQLGPTLGTLIWAKSMNRFEHVHPLDGGMQRQRSRRERRATLPRETIVSFYGWTWWKSLIARGRLWLLYRRWNKVLKEVVAAPDRYAYTDLATTPIVDDEFAQLDLYRATAGGGKAVERKKRDDALRARYAGAAADN
jgi:hypothetical protein